LVLGGLLVLFGVGWFLETVSDVEVPWSVLLPSILILVGLALIAGARSARRQPGMVTFGIVLTVMLALGSGFDVTFGGGIGQRVEDPAFRHLFPCAIALPCPPASQSHRRPPDVRDRTEFA